MPRASTTYNGNNWVSNQPADSSRTRRPWSSLIYIVLLSIICSASSEDNERRMNLKRKRSSCDDEVCFSS